MVIVYLTKKLEETDSFDFGRSFTWYLETLIKKKGMQIGYHHLSKRVILSFKTNGQ